MNTGFSWERFHRFPVVGILRGFTMGQFRSILEASMAGGLTNLEITMNTPSAADQIARARDLSGALMNIGAGTVTSLSLLKAALAAGASFIVTPTVRVDVIEACVAGGIPVFPGAFSPDEICRAWSIGASMVKVFPAENLGPHYIADLKEAFPQIRLMPTGGVDLETLPAFRRAGADAFGVGSPLFSKDRIQAGDYDWMRKQVAAFREAANR